ncbi:hypothetical protein A3A66_04920 [Microgenomates group bacterium RIFCSPLOWO2_01_FULL_46_13]|nr:MAG: hypothetical protein A2783_02245 [Microgenomates group bacterium RIFCSPHIGHO2_01_FULL_45_11]OGV94304.1 MAG: hypothetical protein A3A66_04920 [Microgenomates group bacterium RIFCSPLOWO2_01_FULL_46_13]
MAGENQSNPLIDLGKPVEITSLELANLRETFEFLTNQLLRGQITLQTYQSIVESLEQRLARKENERYLYESGSPPIII